MGPAQNVPALDLSEVRHIERIVFGRYNPNGNEDDAHMQRQIEKLNRCLNASPKGVLTAKDTGFKIFKMGENTVVAQQVAYHIGFKFKCVIHRHPFNYTGCLWTEKSNKDYSG